MNKRYVGIVILAVVVCLSMIGVSAAVAQYQTKVYFDTGGNRMVVASGGEIEMQSGAALDIQSGTTGSITVPDLTATDDLAVTDDASVGGDTTLTGVLIQGNADLTVTDGLTITPAYNVYNLDSAGAVTATLAACTTAQEGLIVWFVGDDANNITFADTNIRTSDGSVLVLGQYDLGGFMCIDTEWVEIAKSTNS